MKKLIYTLIALISISCSSGESDGPNPEAPTPKNPETVVLVYPEQNSECTTGTNATVTNSTVEFEWNTSKNTDVYELSLKNLESGNTTTHSTTTNKISIELLKGTPYSWFVVSKSNSVNNTAKSQTWKFYNAGNGKVSYAPFPAEAVTPANNENIDVTDKVTLDWNGSDVDNDIATYDVYFGTATTPPSIKTDHPESILTDLTVSSGVNYYWYIITKDEEGNISQSEIFKFNVN